MRARATRQILHLDMDEGEYVIHISDLTSLSCPYLRTGYVPESCLRSDLSS